MGHSNGRITAPVNTDDVALVLGVNSHDVRTLCTHQRINKDSLIKPIRTRDSSGNPIPGVMPEDFGNPLYNYGYTTVVLSGVNFSALLNAAKNQKWELRAIEAIDYTGLHQFDGYDDKVRVGNWCKPEIIVGGGIYMLVKTRLEYASSTSVVHPKYFNAYKNWYSAFVICEKYGDSWTPVYAECDTELTPTVDPNDVFDDNVPSDGGTIAKYPGTFEGEEGGAYIAINFLVSGKFQGGDLRGLANMPWRPFNILLPNINAEGECISDEVTLSEYDTEARYTYIITGRFSGGRFYYTVKWTSSNSNASDNVMLPNVGIQFAYSNKGVGPMFDGSTGPEVIEKITEISYSDIVIPPGGSVSKPEGSFAVSKSTNRKFVIAYYYDKNHGDMNNPEKFPVTWQIP